MSKPLPVNRAAFHITDSSMYRKCRLRWHFGSRVRLNLTTLAPPRALWLGTGIHHALEWYYASETQADPAELFIEWAGEQLDKVKAAFPGLNEERLAEFEEDIELGTGMMEHYVAWAPTVDNFKVIDTESKLVVPDFITGVTVPVIHPDGTEEIWNSVPYEGMGDMLVRSEADGQYWVVEHKTTRQLDTERLILEEQPGVYQWAMGKKHDVNVAGVIFNFLRKKLPTVPDLLKSGELTQRSNIDTTHDVYMATILQHELDPKDYEETLTRLMEKGNTFFLREAVTRSDTELQQLLLWLSTVGREMFSGPAIYSAPDIIGCKMCPFQGPCIALHDGSDWKYLLTQNYDLRKDDEQLVGAELQSPDSVL